MPVLVSPSILGAGFLNLGDGIRMLNSCADLIHLDIMDGVLVPNISFGFPVVDAISKVAEIPMEAHLMTVHPQMWFGRLVKSGVSYISFHLEAAGSRATDLVSQLHSLGAKAGIAIDPDVPARKLFPYIGLADFFVVMSVYAGFGGQKFIPDTFSKLIELKAEIRRRGASTLLEVDGGVNAGNASELVACGTDILVAGSAVFNAQDPAAVVAGLKAA